MSVTRASIIIRASIITEDEDETLIKCEIIEERRDSFAVIGLENRVIWLPRSQCEILPKVATFEDSSSEVMVPNWLINKKKLV